MPFADSNRLETSLPIVNISRHLGLLNAKVSILRIQSRCSISPSQGLGNT